MKLEPAVSLPPVPVAPSVATDAHSHATPHAESRDIDTFVPHTSHAAGEAHAHHHEDTTSSRIPELDHIHDENEDEILEAVKNMPVSAVSLAERAISTSTNLELSEPCLPTMGEFAGTYRVAPGSGYVVNAFTIEPQDVVSASGAGPEFDAVQAQVDAQDPHNSGVAAYLTIRKSNVDFKPGILGTILRNLPGDVVYILTVSNNGIVRFHLPPERSIFTKMLFAYVDSEPGFFSWAKNLWHAIKHGCYCFGLFFRGQPADSVEKTGGAPVLMRYNRWADGITPYWAAVNAPQEANEVAESTKSPS